MKKTMAATGITIGVILIIVLLFYILTVSGAIHIFIPNPSAPEIRYGEFPITVTYELNGVTKTIEDTIICEFDGFKNLGESGKIRNWEASLKSGNENLTLLDLRSLDETTESGYKILELYFYYGTAAYYMGDFDNPLAKDTQGLEYISFEYQTRDGRIGHSGYDADTAFDKYGIRLISREVAQPIQNSFSR